MFINQIAYNGQLTIDYSLSTERLTLTSEERPAKEFFEAGREMKAVLSKSLQIPEDRLGVTGLKIKQTNDGIQYIPTGYLFVPGVSGAEIKIIGVPMVVRRMDYFRENGVSGHPNAMTPQDRMIVFKFILSALHFLEGAREQGELEFEENVHETEDSLIIRDQITEAERDVKEYLEICEYWVKKEMDPEQKGEEGNLFEGEPLEGTDLSEVEEVEEVVEF